MKRKVALVLGLGVVAVVGFKMGGMFGDLEETQALLGPNEDIFAEEMVIEEGSPLHQHIRAVAQQLAQTSDPVEKEELEKIYTALMQQAMSEDEASIAKPLFAPQDEQHVTKLGQSLQAIAQRS